MARFLASRVGPPARGQFREGVVEGFRREGGIEPSEGVPEPALKHHLAVIAALGAGLPRSDVWAVDDGPAQALKPGEGGFFDI
jgi:hypothetical protein